jgi:hypothetical protein
MTADFHLIRSGKEERKNLSGMIDRAEIAETDLWSEQKVITVSLLGPIKCSTFEWMACQL